MAHLRLLILLFAAAGAAIPMRSTVALADSEKSGSEEDGDDGKLMSAKTFAGLKLRGIGPGIASGRICDFAVNPANRAEYYAAVCSGGLWKTENAGTTWAPIFDTQGSYSIGCITMDSTNPHVLWVGTGENNSQRSVSFGDGVYRSRDGGKSWEHLGLKESEHIGKIVIDPRDSNTVYVAAQGPLWRSGGDRGLYKTTDGGKTWNRILHISDDTGVNEVHMDPRDPNTLYASAYQRRRHVWTLVNGGPESAIYKSTDAGVTWRKITSGVPDVDKGRIGMCISPVNPDVVYAIIEAQYDKGGFFRSMNRGETWEKRNKYMASSPQYYNEIVCHPTDVDTVYSLDTFMHVTEDGGKTFKPAPREDRHVDDHALWIDPHQPDYMLVGCDGGVYESFDRGANWDYKPNLPVTQFYRVAVDNSVPFYYVYGGTQDNNTLGGPSRTINPAGIPNEQWFVTVGGDGFEPQVDPEDPNIVYSQWQHGGLVRHDRRSGEVVDIKPREKPGDDPYRWNWDSPLLISPHNHQRLYFCCQRVFRSDDRGDSWTAISGDLTRGLDRHKLKVFGRVQSVDAVARHKSTSIYGNIVSFAESPVTADLLYVGTDDGLIHVSDDGGGSWRKEEVFPAVPDITYVSCLTASLHEADTVFAAFDNHKNGDFKPYLLRSTDRGQTWKSIAGDLPERDIVYSIQEDHVNAKLLFAGTEFGVYFTYDGGEHWIKLKGGMPTISVKDIDIQRREHDLVLATFGRGFYILDDYAPLRQIDEELLKKDAVVFPVKNALHYIEASPLGNRSGRGWQGASYYAAPNPPYGATFTYYLKEKVQTRREKRQEAEKKAIKAGKDVKIPSIDELRAEDEEKEPQVLLIVRDAAGEIVRRETASREKGMHRANWDLRYPSTEPTRVTRPEDLPPWAMNPVGPLAAPGTYSVTLAREADGQITELAEPQSFEVVPLDTATFVAANKQEVLDFRVQVAKLQRAMRGSLRYAGEIDARIKHLRKAFVDTPSADPALLAELDALDKRLSDIQISLRGDQTRASREEPTPPSINERVMTVVGDQWYVTSAPTKTQHEQFGFASDEFKAALDLLRKLTDDLQALEGKFEQAGAPWTPGRLPTWETE